MLEYVNGGGFDELLYFDKCFFYFYAHLCLNCQLTLPPKKNVDCTEVKAIIDKNFDIVQIMKFVYKRVLDIVGKLFPPFSIMF